MMKILYSNYNPKENTLSLVVEEKNETIELEPVKQVEEFKDCLQITNPLPNQS